jgi:uroporphyrin-III C-methyltransferase/precorrin-2 dehydrogenase/sirohydrochlorin ferrochelatase
VRRLNDADLVLFDALVSIAALAHAPRARRFFVGKRAGRPAIRQGTINRLMIREARRGRAVVRLKCGDPLVFGRGGEEALALAAAGIPCEIVPGVTTAVAAAGLAGIPVTHRGVSSAFVVVSGHAESAFGPVLTSLEPHSATVVVMMGLGNRAAISRTMRRAGWSGRTPAAILLGASTPAAHVWHGSLVDLDCSLDAPEAEAPGTIVIGAVAGLASAIAAPVGEIQQARGK